MDRSEILLYEKRQLLEEYLDSMLVEKQDFFINNPDAICAIDMNGYMIRLNSVGLNITGYTNSEIKGLKFQNLVPVEELEKVFNRIQEAMSGRVQNYDCKIKHKNGRIIEVNITNVPIFYKDNIIGVYGVARDITEIKRRSDELNKAGEIHNLLINNSLDIISRTDLEGRYLYVSPASTQVLGYKPEELVGRSCFELIHDEDIEQAMGNNGEYPKDGGTTLGVYRVKKKNGDYVWMESLCKPIRDSETSKVTEIITVARDITRRKLAEEKAKGQEIIYRNLIEHSPDAVMVVKEGTILYINDTGGELFGAKEKDEIIGRNVCDFLPPDYFEAVQEQIKQINNGNTAPFLEQVCNGLDGRVIDAEIKGIPTIYQNEPAIHLIIRDIQERKQTQKLLIEAEKLTVAGQLAAGIAHEVRNPLTAIKGFVQLMEKHTNDEKVYLQIIGSEINRIELILSELLTLAKPQDLKFERCNVTSLIEQVITLIETQAIMHGIEIITLFRTDISEIICDENQLKQVFINILKNSIEAMPEGGIITVEVRNDVSDRIKLLFKDTGGGIPSHVLKRIGEPFFTTKESGTGLGLMISKQIIENHHSHISFLSDSAGTIIKIDLPVRKEL